MNLSNCTTSTGLGAHPVTVDLLLETASKIRSATPVIKRFDVSPLAYEMTRAHTARVGAPVPFSSYAGIPIVVRNNWTGVRVEKVYADKE